MGSCCTVNRDPLQTIIPVPLTNTNKLNSEDLKEKKTSMCLSKKKNPENSILIFISCEITR